jgi:ribulose-phosphate 3-epimerase
MRGGRINPATPPEVLEEILPELDQVMVMTVNPGFGHQHFLHRMLPKIEPVRQMIERLDGRCDVGVDGGIDQETALLADAAGTRVLVAGSSIFADNAGVATAMSRLRASIAHYKSTLLV